MVRENDLRRFAVLRTSRFLPNIGCLFGVAVACCGWMCARADDRSAARFSSTTNSRSDVLGKVDGWVAPSVLFSQGGTAMVRNPEMAANAQSAVISPASKKSGTLTRVSQIRALTVDQARSSLPVALEGVVTAKSDYGSAFFLQDSSAGISIECTDDVELRVGDRVQIEGVSGPGLFAPVVQANKVRVIGHGPVPAAKGMTYRDIAKGAQDSQWIEVEGIVHSSRKSYLFDHQILVLDLQVDDRSVNIQLEDVAGFDSESLIDAKVRIRGVCYTDFNDKRQLVGVGLLVPNRNDIEVLQPANADKFAITTTPVNGILQFGEGSHRVKVIGVATYQVPGHVLYLQDGNDGIRIQTSSTEVIKPGARVEAVGFPVAAGYAPILQDALIRVSGSSSIVPPLPIKARDVIVQKAGFYHVSYDEQLVQLQGKLVESYIRSGDRVWILMQDGVAFEAHVPVASTGGIQQAGLGSTLLVTGICTVNVDADDNALSFSVLLRSPRDIAVSGRGPWWTPFRALSSLATLAGVTIVISLWVLVLKSRVEQQTRIIRASEGRFRHLAEHDALTGLANRLMLEEKIAECLAGCKSAGLAAVVLTADIDRFKHINDNYGHPIGDQILKIVATRLLSGVRKTDIIARTGGEEFTIVLGGLQDAEGARRVTSSILDLFLDPVRLSDHEIKVTVSIGAALFPDDGVDSETLRKRSDQALYEAKRTGRNRSVFATKELSDSTELTSTIEAALREGLRSDKFALYYQPICDRSGAICRFEALLRTSDERLAQLGPSEFIRVAEESGLIIPLGRWVLEETCRQIAEWQTLELGHFRVAVNISGRQLTRKGFAEETLQMLETFHIAPELLELELTETTIMTELGSVAETVAHLAAAGLTFAIDDFGTGYSSLSRLCELPIKTLKVDRTFVNSLDKTAGNSTIISAVVQMAKSLGLEVVAEGVESSRQFTLLRNLGCDFFQGYLFSQPLPAASVRQVVAENRSRRELEEPVSR